MTDFNVYQVSPVTQRLGVKRLIGQPRHAVRLFGNIKPERRFDPGSNARLQHSNGEMGIENHHHPVAGNGDADGPSPTGCAGISDDAHFVGLDGCRQSFYEGLEWLVHFDYDCSGIWSGILGTDRQGQYCN